MQPIYHILGSDIPHHNQRVLTFFQQELLPTLPPSSHYFYVVGKDMLKTYFPDLEITTFSTQKQIAQALIAKISKIRPLVLSYTVSLICGFGLPLR